MGPNSPAIVRCTASRSTPSSATRTRRGKRAVLKTPLEGCAALFPARPISPHSRTAASVISSPSITTLHENALTSKPPPRLSAKCCTSSVNPPPCFRRDDNERFAAPHSAVVRPHAGTHNHKRFFEQKLSATVPNREAAEYGSLLSCLVP